MRQARITSAGGWLAVLLLVGCGGVGSNSITDPPGGAIPSRTASAAGVTPKPGRVHCGQGFKIRPKNGVVKVNQPLYLYNEFVWEEYFLCYYESEFASWTASGGTLQPIYGGKEAVFSATLPGVYHVKAKWNSRIAKATVTVTLP